MDLLSELETMATNVTQSVTNDGDIKADVSRWQSLFGYSFNEASTKLDEHRKGLDRHRVSDELWRLVQEEEIPKGHNRESYEHALRAFAEKVRYQRLRTCSNQAAHMQSPSSASNQKYIVKLEGPLNTADEVRDITKLSETPLTLSATDEAGEHAEFAIIDAHVKEAIMQHFKDSGFRPTTVRISMAEKDLSSESNFPLLGTDTTLPQFRPFGQSHLRPVQDQYPVWYFFYGTLAEPQRLKKMFGVDTDPVFHKSFVLGGKIVKWRGKYKGLVDGDHWSDRVEGCAYLVESKEQEDILRYYETDKYEVVRCDMQFTAPATIIRGLTFRFLARN